MRDLIHSTIFSYSIDLPFREILLLYSLYNLSILFWFDLRQYFNFNIKNIPNQLISRISQKSFNDSQQINKKKFRFAVFRRMFNEFIHLLILYFNILPLLWELSEQILIYLNYSKHYGIIHNFVFLCLLTIIVVCKGLPFEYIMKFDSPGGGMVETAKEISPGQFFLFTLKESFATIMGIGACASLFLWIMEQIGEKFYWYIALLTFIIYSISITLWPAFVGPFYSEIRTLPKGALRQDIERLCKNKKIKFPVTEIYTVDPNQEKHHCKMYFFGIGNNYQIVLYDNLVKKCGSHEIIALLAHELAHWKYWHNFIFIIFRHIHLLIIFLVFGHLIDNSQFYESFGVLKGEKPHFVGLVLVKYMYDPIETFIGSIGRFITHHQEYKADNFAIELGFAEKLKNALLHIDFNRGILMVPDRLRTYAYDERPPLIYRLENITKNCKK